MFTLLLFLFDMHKGTLMTISTEKIFLARAITLFVIIIFIPLPVSREGYLRIEFVSLRFICMCLLNILINYRMNAPPLAFSPLSRGNSGKSGIISAAISVRKEPVFKIPTCYGWVWLDVFVNERVRIFFHILGVSSLSRKPVSIVKVEIGNSDRRWI